MRLGVKRKDITQAAAICPPAVGLESYSIIFNLFPTLKYFQVCVSVYVKIIQNSQLSKFHQQKKLRTP